MGRSVIQAPELNRARRIRVYLFVYKVALFVVLVGTLRCPSLPFCNRFGKHLCTLLYFSLRIPRLFEDGRFCVGVKL